VCKKHSITSISISTPTVHPTNSGNPITPNRILPVLIKLSTVISKKTLANYPCARLSAQSLKKLAVFEILPSTNSITSIN